MLTILVITPDPARKKMFELAFGLSGFSVITAADFVPKQLRAEKPTVVLVDIVSNAKAEWNMAIGVCKQKKPKKVLLLPHGQKPEELPKSCKNADIVVKRPYELMELVRKVTSFTIPKRSSSSRRTPRQRS